MSERKFPVFLSTLDKREYDWKEDTRHFLSCFYRTGCVIIGEMGEGRRVIEDEGVYCSVRVKSDKKGAYSIG